jgi:cytochrome oxidase assembly protein ShyY1
VRPAILGGAVATAAAAGVLVRLAAWQWERGSSRDSLLNYSYGVQWALLAVALVAAVATRHRRGGREAGEQASRDVTGRVIGPPLRPGEELGETTSVRVRRRLSRRSRAAR